MPFTIERGDDPYLDELWDQAEQRGQLKGRLQGRLEGKIEGKLEGKREGQLEGKIDFMRKSLELRFGPLPSWAAAQLSTATDKLLDSWLTRLHTASRLEDVLLAN